MANIGIVEIVSQLIYLAVLWVVIYTAVRTANRHSK